MKIKDKMKIVIFFQFCSSLRRGIQNYLFRNVGVFRDTASVALFRLISENSREVNILNS